MISLKPALRIEFSENRIFCVSGTFLVSVLILNGFCLLNVCIEIALRGIAHGIGRPTEPRGLTHWNRGFNVPTPWYHQYRVTHPGYGLFG